MRFLKATDIPMKLRKPHLNLYRAQLRDALLNPSLTESQKINLKERLASLGSEKPYAALAAAKALPKKGVRPVPLPE